MSPTALALIASAAIAHASWNFFAKQARGGLPFVWLAGLCAATLYALPAAIQLAVGSRSVSAAGIAFMFGSGCLHSAYFTTLQRGYAEGDLSVVYPLARGTGPALSVLAAVVILGERPGPLALVGAAIIVVAVISLAFAGHATPSRARDHLRAAHRGDDRGLHALGRARRRGPRAADDRLLLGLGGDARARPRRARAARPRGAAHRPGPRPPRDPRRRRAEPAGLHPRARRAHARARSPSSRPGREASIVIVSLLGTRVLGEGETSKRAVAAVAILVGIACLAAS